MQDYKSLSHTRWDYKYHLVFIPKKRQKVIFGAIRKHLGDVFLELALRQGGVIEEGHLMKDHVHISHVVGYIKGKSVISIVRNFKGKQRHFTGEAFWARGYFVSTVGLDEEMVRAYIRNQEEQNCHRDQLKFGV